MKKTVSLMILMMCVSLYILPSDAKVVEKPKRVVQQNNICTVADPTGTPLNVRAEPITGKIVARLKNGTVVRVEDFNDEPGGGGDESSHWWQISISSKGKRRTLGWVTSNFLNCNSQN